MYSMHSDALAYTYHGEPFNYAPRNGPHLYFARYIETIRFESICGGKATYIAVLAYLCSDDQVRAYSFWDALPDQATFDRLGESLGGTIRAGDCPLTPQ
ncbi:hypothetical protein DFH06DRAFT_1473657 [Mycena polygramma]|nr:hypothetical protein DFH06DRAFT_1473657 [Mycena polygramma]